LSDNGFLYDPDGEYGPVLNPDLVSFDRFAANPSLALLGEPGIGKSWALKSERASLESSILAKGERALWLDLRSFGSEDRLWKALFGGEEFRNWREGTYLLHVFLDSLDECLLRIDNVASLIADQLPNEPVQRLRLRVACRTAPWPHILEKALIESFGPEGFEAYELVPLRRRDVKEAAIQSGIAQPEVFLQRIEALEVVSLAIKPVTLNFLIKTFSRDGDLPKNQLELYERGCRMLCEESNESRLGGAQTGALDSGQRLAIASRMAAITQFCNRFAIWSGPESGSGMKEDVTISEISGGTEVEVGNIEVSSALVREVLDTGLFTSRGSNRIGWAHQTYAEFLAARFCKTHEMPRQQIRDLIFHPTGRTKRLIPQLRQLSGWISVMVPAVQELVAQSDPESLLGTAGTNLSDEQRQSVAQIILDLSDAGRMLNLRPELYGQYVKLKYRGLATLLKPYLGDKNRRIETREVAVDIARSCELKELAADLCDIAVDLSEPIHLRIPAAAAAAELGSKENRQRLRPLAIGEAGEDPDDEMKGSGLTALWPDLINSAQLFALLSPPKNTHLSGTYSSFLYYKLRPGLQAADLPAALEWFSSQGVRTGGSIDSVMDGIIESAWENLDQPGIPALLAKAVISRIKQQDRIMSGLDRTELEKKVLVEQERRRKLLAEILPQIEESEVYFLGYAGLPILHQEDFPWLIERATATGSATEAKLVRRTINSSDPEQMRLLQRACEQNEKLDAESKDLFEPIMLDSEQARMLREDLRDRQRPQPKLVDPSPQERISRGLSDIEAGDISKWIALTWDLSLEPTSTAYDQTSPDLTSLPGWKAADPSIQARIIQSALRYLREGEPQNEDWFGTNQIYHSAIAGFRALALVSTAAPDELEKLPSGVWAKWVPICLSFSHNNSKIRRHLLKEAHARLPKMVTDLLIRMIDLQRDKPYFLLSAEVDICWDGDLAHALLVRAKDTTFSSEIFKSLIQLLVRHQVAGSRDVVKTLLLDPPPRGGPEKERMMAAIQALAIEAHDVGWTEIWAVLDQHPAFGKEAIASLAYATVGGHGFLKKLTEEQLGRFYRWMLVAYPPSASDHRVAGAVGPSQAAIMFRDQVLQSLKSKSSFAASEAIREVMNSLPQYPWLALHLEEAEELARAATWQPVSPEQFLIFASDSSKRMLDSAEQLLDLILESLNRLAKKLHGELPAIRDLWNIDKNRYWPKDENDFSDYVTRHLDEDIQARGIVVNREVQIRRGTGDRTGQFTDIHVDAIVPGAKAGSYARVYAIVEAKGTWHKELFTAMETQLLDRYLKDNRCQSGIYLVGWFSCAKWDSGDSRKTQCPSMSMNDARARLEQQANELSKGTYDVRTYVLDCSLPS
jgi:hypothetical protein